MGINKIAVNQTGPLLALLGIARKSNGLIIGQDRVRTGLANGKQLLILLATDFSSNVLRMMTGFRDRGKCTIIILEACDRNTLSKALGVNNTQVVAVDRSSGFNKKLLQLASEGGDAFE